MANSNDEPKPVKNLPAQQTDPSTEESLNSPRGFCPKTFMAILSLIIAVAALIIVIYQSLGNTSLQTQLSKENHRLYTELTEFKSQQELSLDEAKNKKETLLQRQQELEDKIASLNTRLQTIVGQQAYHRQDWLLLKARYYLEIAQINSHWTNNYSSSIALLEQANLLLAQLGDPKIFNIRQAINEEINGLKAVATVDVTGILSQLDALTNSISELTLAANLTEDDQPTALDTTISPSTTWKSHWQKSITVLEKLVVIRHHDEMIQPLMSPLLASLFKESIRLNIQEAQWAVLNHNPLLYQQAIKEAIINLQRTFKGKSQQSASLLKQLFALQKIELTEEKPKTGSALSLLNQLIEDNEQSANKVSPSASGDH